MLECEWFEAELKATVKYDPVTGIFTYIKSGRQMVVKNPSNYQNIAVGRKPFSAHRAAWFLSYGRWPRKGLELDHINGIKSDNRLDNLREVTHAENMWLPRRKGWFPS